MDGEHFEPLGATTTNGNFLFSLLTDFNSLMKLFIVCSIVVSVFVRNKDKTRIGICKHLLKKTLRHFQRIFHPQIDPLCPILVEDSHRLYLTVQFCYRPHDRFGMIP
jgi:hypothetical protein